MLLYTHTASVWLTLLAYIATSRVQCFDGEACANSTIRAWNWRGMDHFSLRISKLLTIPFYSQQPQLLFKKIEDELVLKWRKAFGRKWGEIDTWDSQHTLTPRNVCFFLQEPWLKIWKWQLAQVKLPKTTVTFVVSDPAAAYFFSF